MTAFSLSSVVGWACVVAVARLVRGRPYAIYAGVLLGVYTLIANALAPRGGLLFAVFAYLHATVYASFLLLARPRMRPTWFRAIVSWPASWFLGSTLLAFPWAIASGFGLRSVSVVIPYAVALVGLVDTFFPRRGSVSIPLGESQSPELVRSPRTRGNDPGALRVVQITDPHLGPFMSVARLRRICERAVAKQPDLLLLTGDFLTMESQGDATLLGQALMPLRQLEGRTFACFGNHDHEAPKHVRDGLASAGVKLLVDELAVAPTRLGEVEILGFDFRFRDRAAHLASVVARHPRTDRLRIGLLHDPGAFRQLPAESADLVVSGHTHGGQVGLLWLGLPHTIVSALSRVPDHGLWSRGKDRLYVHRGTGHYGFPLRLGVPPEESVLEVVPARGEITP